MSMNKKYKYRGETFNISVELNTKAERHIDGKTWSTVTVTNESGSYHKKEEVENVRLKMYLRMDVIYDIDKFVNEELDGFKGLEQELKELGYE